MEEESSSSTLKKDEKEEMSKSLRNFGLNEFFDEIKSEIIPNKESYDELSEKKLKKTDESDDEIEIFEDDDIIEHEVTHVDDFAEKKVLISRINALDNSTKSYPIQTYLTYLNGSEGLKNAILIKEILGPPRAIERYRFRPFR